MERIIAFALVLLLGSPLATSAQEIMDRQLAIQALKHTDQGLRYLRSGQAEDGSWSGSVEVTALALRAFLESYQGYSEEDGAFITRPVSFLLAHANEDGSIGGGDGDRVSDTALAMIALKATKNPAHEAVIREAQDFLRRSLAGESKGVDRDSADYGAIGGEDPDLATQYRAIEALRATGLDASDALWEKAMAFVSRLQRLDSDGGFVATPEDRSAGAEASGGMTQAGLASLLFAGVGKDDPRVEAAWRWIGRNYGLDREPGSADQGGLFFYYAAFAKGMRAYAEATLEDGQGKTRNWRNDLADRLLALHEPDGSWSPAVQDADRHRSTALALIALNQVIHSLR